jgi:hypothetical protein
MRHQPIQHRPEFLARMARLKYEERNGRNPGGGRKALSNQCMQRGQWGAWDSGTMLTLANPRCHQCGGMGHLSVKGTVQPCRCVLRQVFRRCYDRWRVIEAEPVGCSSVTLERLPGRSRGQSYGRKKEEFAADFFLVSRRTLAEDPLLWQIFRLHVLRGAEWRLCTLQLRIDRGTYFHAVYEMEEKLGRVFHELRPYALHPVSDYFGKRIQSPGWSAAQ